MFIKSVHFALVLCIYVHNDVEITYILNSYNIHWNWSGLDNRDRTPGYILLIQTHLKGSISCVKAPNCLPPNGEF